MKEVIIKGYQNPTGLIVNITVGCDPEFDSLLINDSGELESVEPEQFLQRMYGRDHDVNSNDPIGRDANCGPIELRPAPSDNPKIVIENIRKMIEEINRSNQALGASGHNSELGGHIHIGTGLQYSNISEIIPTNTNIGTLLDGYIGFYVVDLNGGSRASIFHGQSRYEYGFWSDVKSQPHGLEYRTPSAAIFTTPDLAEDCLTIAKRIGERHYNGKNMVLSGMTRVPMRNSDSSSISRYRPQYIPIATEDDFEAIDLNLNQFREHIQEVINDNERILKW